MLLAVLLLGILFLFFPLLLIFLLLVVLLFLLLILLFYFLLLFVLLLLLFLLGLVFLFLLNPFRDGGSGWRCFSGSVLSWSRYCCCESSCCGESLMTSVPSLLPPSKQHQVALLDTSLTSWLGRGAVFFFGATRFGHVFRSTACLAVGTTAFNHNGHHFVPAH